MVSRIISQRPANVSAKYRVPNCRVRALHLRSIPGRSPSWAGPAESPQLATPDGPLARFLCELQLIASTGHASPQQLKDLRQFIDENVANEPLKTDARFVKGCLDYGTYSGTMTETLEFMAAAGIGRTRASFYYHWASHLAASGRVMEAKKAVDQGIAANALPLTLLTQLRRDLDSRHPRNSQASTNAVEMAKKIGTNIQPFANIRSPNEKFHRDEPTKVAINVYEDEDSSGDDDISTEISEQLLWSYPEQLLKYRKFSEPVRPFSEVPVPLMVHCIQPEPTTAGSGLTEIIYGPHGGATEPIAAAQFAKAGDTETLK